MVDITFIVPFASYHQDIVKRAVASVHAQTVPCAVITIEDTDRRGPGWARNQGLAQVVTPFVAFLDADDTIAPNWAEQALAAYRPAHYVYTDWWEGPHIVHAPDCPWVVRDKGVRTFHVITALLKTEDALRVGFNEDMQGAEDTEFYRRLTLAHGVCGIRLPLPLFYYGHEGQRSQALHDTPTYRAVIEKLDNQWRGKMSSCAKCGNGHVPAIAVEIPTGAALQDGYVWVVANWSGNRRHRGIVTGNVYPSSGNGKVTQVDARDQQAAPDTYYLIEVDRGYERRGEEPEPDDLARVGAFEVVRVATLADLFRKATGATDPPPPAYDPYAGQAVGAGKARDLSKVMSKLGEMLG